MQFCLHPSPNPLKVALLLEELGAAYDLVTIDTFKGEQHAPSFLSINPNAKVPAIVTDDGTTVFDSNAILVYLAEKAGRFMPKSDRERGEMLSWLFFVATGLSPFSGQAIHFLHMAPEDLPYAKHRYLREVERHYRVLDTRLARSTYLAGSTCGIADMALWGWANFAGTIFGDNRKVGRAIRTMSSCLAFCWSKRRPLAISSITFPSSRTCAARCPMRG